MRWDADLLLKRKEAELINTIEYSKNSINLNAELDVLVLARKIKHMVGNSKNIAKQMKAFAFHNNCCVHKKTETKNLEIIRNRNRNRNTNTNTTLKPKTITLSPEGGSAVKKSLSPYVVVRM